MASGFQGGPKCPPHSQRGRKRSAPAPTSFPSTSFTDDDKEYTCPICFGIIDEAYMTKCGHSFCHRCILHRLELTGKCPSCNEETRDGIYPNFLLNHLVLKHKERLRGPGLQLDVFAGTCPGLDMPASSIIADKRLLDLAKVNELLEALQQKKQKLEYENKMGHSQLLLEFLEEVKKKKQEHLDRLSLQLDIIAKDIEQVGRALCPGGEQRPPTYSGCAEMGDRKANGCTDGFNTQLYRYASDVSMATRRQKLNQHMDDLEQHYFSSRLSISEQSPGGGPTENGLDEFMRSLEKFTRYTSFRTLATLQYNSDLFGTSSIVSSVEFDKDSDYFAVAGVTKRIKVFEYESVITDLVDVHYPVAEMACSSKISCVAWSRYHKSLLASADYEGAVTLWDAFTATKKQTYQEHEKRCWCVDFNRIDPSLLASGSDDTRVKIWATNAGHSVASIDARANVCCVQFNPDSRFHVAFGSTDHCVHYYDMRNLKQALAVLRGHRKAVSFIRFASSSEIVSASVDSQLRLWDVGGATAGTGDQQQPRCVRVLQGHVNEKSFVGLATDGHYVACGSEDNTLCVYYKGMSQDLMRHRFDATKSPWDRDYAAVVTGAGAANGEDDVASPTAEFVSAVTWKPSSNVLVAANSQGLVKVIELV